ncbi:hypothetical protein FQV39_05375 [Bosea sp. F3-2]|nr:hypothetical protein FQV39_05375 [Bosea sp. F3-2]
MYDFARREIGGVICRRHPSLFGSECRHEDRDLAKERRRSAGFRRSIPPRDGPSDGCGRARPEAATAGRHAVDHQGGGAGRHAGGWGAAPHRARCPAARHCGLHPRSRIGRPAVSRQSVLSSSLVPRALHRFRERHPQSEVTLMVLPSRDIRDGVISGAFDLGLTSDEIDVSGVKQWLFVRPRLSCIMPAGHPLAGRGGTTLTCRARAP